MIFFNVVVALVKKLNIIFHDGIFLLFFSGFDAQVQET